MCISSIYSLHRELKRLLLIIENFVPIEVKTRLYTQSRYDEEQEEWSINPHQIHDTAPNRRPVSQPSRRRPVSEFALKQIKIANANAASTANSNASSSPESPSYLDSAIRYKGENILNYELDLPLRTTNDYKDPTVSPSLRAVLAEAMQTDDVLEISGMVRNKFLAEDLFFYICFCILLF